jgi:hypothetical protein
MKKSFILHVDSLSIIEQLKSEQTHSLLLAFYHYHIGKPVQLDPTMRLVFSFFERQFERDNEKYRERVNINKDNGFKGGRPKKAKGTEKTHSVILKPKKADSDSDSDNDLKEKNIKKERDINLGIDPSSLPIEIQNQEGMGGGEIHALRKWIATDLPNVSKMKTQLTNQNCEDLIEEFGKKLIQNVLEAMENVNGIQKKYTSVNLTVRNWAKKRVEDHPELKPKHQPVEMPNWFPQADE